MQEPLTGRWLALRCLALVAPVLLICLGTQLQGVETQTKEALKWTGVGLLIFQVVSTACSWYVWRFGYLLDDEEALVPLTSQ